MIEQLNEAMDEVQEQFEQEKKLGHSISLDGANSDNLKSYQIHNQSTGLVEQSVFYEAQIDQLKQDLEKLKQTEQELLHSPSMSNSFEKTKMLKNLKEAQKHFES